MTENPFDNPVPPEEREIIPAATVVIFRKCPEGGPPQLLMVQRAKKMRFAGGAAVFPGGRIDPEDRTLARQLAPDSDQEIAAARVAGIRETLEETGLLIATHRPVSAAQAADARAMLLDREALAPVLDHFDWQLDLESLAYFTRWRPAVKKRAFDTRFFLANLGTGAVDITVDATENTRMFWTSAKQALKSAETGDLSLIFPTRRNLDRLALFASFDEAREQAAQFPVKLIEPNVEVRDGERWLTIPDGCGYPVLGQLLDSAEFG